MANNCLVTKLKGTVTGDLPQIGSFRIRVGAGKFCIGVANTSQFGQMTVKANGISQCNHLYAGASEPDVVTFPFTPSAATGNLVHEFYGEAANDFYIDIIDNYNLLYIGTMSRLGAAGYTFGEFSPNYDVDWSVLKYRSNMDAAYIYGVKGFKASCLENKNALYSIRVGAVVMDNSDNNFTQVLSQPTVRDIDFTGTHIDPNTDLNVLATHLDLTRLVTASGDGSYIYDFKKESFCNAMADNGRTSGTLRMILNSQEFDTGSFNCTIYFVPKSEEHPNGWYEVSA